MLQRTAALAALAGGAAAYPSYIQCAADDATLLRIGQTVMGVNVTAAAGVSVSAVGADGKALSQYIAGQAFTVRVSGVPAGAQLALRVGDGAGGGALTGAALQQKCATQLYTSTGVAGGDVAATYRAPCDAAGAGSAALTAVFCTARGQPVLLASAAVARAAGTDPSCSAPPSPATPAPATPPPAPVVIDEYDVVIGGAGGGGLSAAAVLAKGGKKVLVVDRANRVGGAWVHFNLTGDDGFVYRAEGSLHVLQSPIKNWSPTAPPLKVDYWKLLQDIGVFDKLKIQPRDLIHRVVLDKAASKAGFNEFNIWTNPQRMMEELEAKGFPGTQANISKLLDFSQKVMNFTNIIGQMKYMEPGIKKDEMYAWAASHFGPMAESMAMSVKTLAGRWIKDPELLTLVASPVLYCGVPPGVLASILYAEMAGMWWELGMSYPSGGSGTIARVLAEYVEANGGKIMLNTEVTEIVTESTDDTTCAAKAAVDGKCRVATGLKAVQYGKQPIVVKAKAVISDINTPRTIQMVGKENWPAKYLKQIDKLNVSDSAFNVILPLRNNSCMKKLNGAHEVILADNLDMDDLFSRLRAGEDSMVTFGDFGTIDADFCCGGKDSGRGLAAIINPLPMRLFPEDEAERAKFRTDLANRMIDRVDRYVPGFRDSIDFSAMMVIDPYDLQGWMGTPDGTEMGFYPDVLAEIPKGPVPGVPMQPTAILGLFQVGQFSFPGGGQPTVSMGGQQAGYDILMGTNMPQGVSV